MGAGFVARISIVCTKSHSFKQNSQLCPKATWNDAQWSMFALTFDQVLKC